MDKQANLAHWESWAAVHGDALRATTKCITIKRLELDAIQRSLATFTHPRASVLLEVGCGNGFNGFALVANNPRLRYVGVDFSATMIAHAQTRLHSSRNDRMAFAVADARDLKVPFNITQDNQTHGPSAFSGPSPIEAFDVVLTDRMLINLASTDEQLEVMERLVGTLRPEGLFLMLENSVQSHRALNQVRLALGLEVRTPPEFNLLIDDESVIDPFRRHMELIHVEYLSSLHDLMLYAVCPASEGGDIVYDTPLMTRLTDAIIARNQFAATEIRGLGQNVLWVWRNRA